MLAHNGHEVAGGVTEAASRCQHIPSSASLEDRRRGPTFMIMGAMRCGTTSLYDRMRSLDDVFLTTPKEPHFFSQELYQRAAGPGDGWTAGQVVRDWHAYLRLFDGAGNRPRGEASATYLYHPQAAEHIARLFPEVRGVVLLRHPTDRAYSAYWQLRAQGREPLDSFADALAAEERRIAEGWGPMWHYLAAGRYGAQLTRLYGAVGEGHVLTMASKDARSAEGFKRICAHVGLESGAAQEGETVKNNASGRPRSQALNRLLYPVPGVRRTLRKVSPPRLTAWVREARMRNLTAYPPLDETLRQRLDVHFAEDIDRVAELTDGNVRL